MKKFIMVLSLSFTIGAVITLYSCKKEATAVTPDDSMSAQDVNSISSAVNTTSDDATAVAGQVQSFSGKNEGWRVLCGATTVDTSHSQIVINYDGSSDCFGVLRSGQIVVSLTSGTHWRDMGAQLTVVYTNLKVTDVISGNSYTINGTHVITNETGGLAWRVAFGLDQNTAVRHRNQSNFMSVTFADGSVKTWNVDRTREWNSVASGSSNLITVNFYSENNGGVDMWGTNRYGSLFTNSITTTVSANNYGLCAWKPYQGKWTHIIGNRTTTVLFGTDVNGNVVGTPSHCGLGFFITSTNSNTGHTAGRFVSYW